MDGLSAVQAGRCRDRTMELQQKRRTQNIRFKKPSVWTVNPSIGVNPLASTQPRRDLADCLFPNVAMLSRSVALPQRSTTALLALTLAAALDRIDVTVRTRWQQLLRVPLGFRSVRGASQLPRWSPTGELALLRRLRPLSEEPFSRTYECGRWPHPQQLKAACEWSSRWLPCHELML